MHKLKLLHTEASTGWGGQEIRIVREAQALIERGHEVAIAAQPGAQILDRASSKGITTFEIDYERRLGNLRRLGKLLTSFQPSAVITHSSLDAWMAGLAAKWRGIPVVRMRHLSAHIKKGLNSKMLYRWLANGVVTTCEEVAERIRLQAGIGPVRCQSIPTGIDPASVEISPEAIRQFRLSCGIQPYEVVAGTCCVLRSWKGISTMLEAAHQLRNEQHLRWLIVGDGPCTERYKQQAERLQLGDRVIFTGQLENPFPAIAAMDIFLLLSTANEGVSQSSLQAAALSKPLITTRVGGLHEVCRDHKTGITVDTDSPEQVSAAVTVLLENKTKRLSYGAASRELVLGEYHWQHSVDQVEAFYQTYSR